MIEWIVSSSVLILAVLLLRLLLGRYIGKRLQCSLWVLVLLRLLIPFSLMESPAGAGQMVSGLTEQPVIQAAVGNLDPQQRYDAAVSEVLAAHDFAVEDYAALPEEQQNSITHTYRQEIQQKVETFDTAYSAAQVLRAVWLVGVVIMGLWLLTANLRFGGKLRRSRKKYSGSFSVPVYTAAVETPCLFGLFRPAIYLPECIGDEKTAAHILTHEQTHYRHWDHIWAAARCLCLALHWYNPLVWVAVKVSRTDSELACDEGALAVLGEEQRSDYGRTLIEMSRGKPSAGELLLTATTMTGDKKTLLRRVQSIAKKPKILAIAVVIISVLAAAILLWAFTGAESEQPAETSSTETTEPVQTTAPAETTVPVETTEPVELNIQWEFEKSGRSHYTYEDYFAFERWYRAEDGATGWKIHASAEDGSNLTLFTYVVDGRIYLRSSDETVRFQVGEKTYEDLTVFGTDSYQWIYCAENGKRLFRVDPLGNEEDLFLAEYGNIRIVGGNGWEYAPDAAPRIQQSDFQLCDTNNAAFFVAGTPEGWGIYRIHLQSKRVDLIHTGQEPIYVFSPWSNYTVRWFSEPDGEVNETPGKQWDLNDPDVQYFQKLLAPGTDWVLGGTNNWYNNALGVSLRSTEDVSPLAPFYNGFRDLPTKLTQAELEALGDAADPEKDYYKLPGKRVDAVLMLLYGVTRAELPKEVVSKNEDPTSAVLYDPETDTYYTPCLMEYNYGEPVDVLIWQASVTVHKVERKEDGTVWVYYMAGIPVLYQSDSVEEERLMILQEVDGRYRILSNLYAVDPITGSLIRFL